MLELPKNLELYKTRKSKFPLTPSAWATALENKINLYQDYINPKICL